MFLVQRLPRLEIWCLPSTIKIVMLQGTLACRVHDEYTLARGASARRYAGLLAVASCDAKLLIRVRCYGIWSRKREMSVSLRNDCKDKNLRIWDRESDKRVYSDCKDKNSKY